MPDDATPYFSLVAIVFSGFAMAAFCWLILSHLASFASRTMALHGVQVDAIQMPDRQAAMPLLWRVSWPLIRYLGRVLCIARGRSEAHARPISLDRAGLPPGIHAVHITAARVLGAAMLTVVIETCVLFLSARPPGDPFMLSIAVSALVVGACMPGLWLRARTRRRKVLIERELPFFLDLLALCVQGGLSIQGAMHESVRYGPQGILREEVAQVLAELRAGQSRTQAFEALARRSGSRLVRASVGAILQAEALGISLGNQLKEQARAQATARFERAERQALKAPVKLLLPLVVFIFPCTFIVIGFPIVMSMRQALA